MNKRATHSLLLLCVFGLAGCVVQDAPADPADPTAVAVPMLSLNPTFDKRMGEGEWDDAARLDGSFTISDGSPADGTYPFRAWIGATADGLLLAVEVENRTANPFSTEQARWADALFLFFKTDEAPGLTPPSFSLAGFTEGASTWTDRSFWNGKDWEGDPTAEGATMGADFHPESGTWVRAGAGNGTTLFEIFTPRIPKHSVRNSLHLTPGAEFRMGLAYMRGGGPEEESHSPDARGRFLWPHDAYPGEGYTPHGMYDPAGWLRFRMPA